MEKERPQSEHIWSKLDPAFPPEDGEHRKKISITKKRQPLGYSNMSKSRLYLFFSFREK